MSDTDQIVPARELGDQPLSFADLGIPTGPQVTDTFLGKARRIQDVEKTEILFVVLSCLSIIATAVLSIYKMATTSVTDTDFTFALLLLVNAGFCIFYVIHGVLKERAYELGILLIAVVGIVLYSVLNFSLVDKRGPVKIARLVIVCVMSPPIMLFCVKYGLDYYRSGNLIFRTIGANATLQGICKTLYLFHDLLKLDLQLGISMVILILNSTVDVALDDYIILSVGGVFSIIWFIIGFFSSRNENTVGMVFFFLGSPVEPAYVLYKMVKSAEQVDTNLKSASLTCGVLALGFRVILIIYSVLVWRNFGKGLKEKEISSKTTDYKSNQQATTENPE
ncbi:hypothetical protein LOTGIDRAFT_235699 [Lottia gigantea]|uniref:DUF7789 domain-containing protein n=1 Tax=Lottia gigantea TaxID=225164 RepID=V3ZTR5_LOTGI|nr:hypothetical protein LOTGIDRAFT_235699 [Lottia gigantea]ESO85935.1 hypothetical protein LOTGIDRAFT_235699 [Lottia gigantea]